MPGKYSEWDIKERTKEEMLVPALSSHAHEWTFICIGGGGGLSVVLWGQRRRTGGEEHEREKATEKPLKIEACLRKRPVRDSVPQRH